jgi:hypothetical protein
MPSITTIGAAIKSVIASATGVGNVYDHIRFSQQDLAFQNIAVTGGAVNFWQFQRSRSDETWVNEFQFKRHFTFTIWGYYGVKDETATSKTFQGLVDRIASRFRSTSNRTLGGTVERIADSGAGGLQINTIDHRMAHGVLVHFCEAVLQVYGNPENF